MTHFIKNTAYFKREFKKKRIKSNKCEGCKNYKQFLPLNLHETKTL